MLQSEFEEMTGKKVTAETFRIYELMYLGTPETTTKQDFVKMLNIDSIPEDPEILKAREESRNIQENAKQEINSYKIKIAEATERKNDATKNANYWKDVDDYFYNSCKKSIKYINQEIRRYKNKIKTIKFLFNV